MIDYELDYDIYNQIFHKLIVYNIKDAIIIAENNNLYHLAMLLSQLNSDETIIHLIKYQLNLWKTMNSIHLIPKNLIKIYCLISGDFYDTNSILNESIVMEYHWIHIISMNYWYLASNEQSMITIENGMNISMNNSLSNAMNIYEEALSLKLVQSPTKLNSTVIDGLYPLLKFLTSIHSLNSNNQTLINENNQNLMNENSMNDNSMHLMNDNSIEIINENKHRKLLIELLKPNGFTNNQLDYRSSYLLMILLQSIGFIDSNDILISIIQQHFISELISYKLWKYAIFIATQINNELIRNNTVKSLLFQYISTNNLSDMHTNTQIDRQTNEKINNELNIPINSNEFYIIKQLNIPIKLIYEIISYNYYNNFQYNLTVKYLHLCNNKQLLLQAKSIICEYIIPFTLLKRKNGTEKLILLLESLNESMNESINDSINDSINNNLMNESLNNIKIEKINIETQKHESEIILEFLLFKQSIQQKTINNNNYNNNNNITITELLNISYNLLLKINKLYQKKQLLNNNNNNIINKSNKSINKTINNQSINQLWFINMFDMGTYLANFIKQLLLSKKDFIKENELNYLINNENININAMNEENINNEMKMTDFDYIVMNDLQTIMIDGPILV